MGAAGKKAGALKWAPWFTIALLVAPVCAGLLGVILPAFGYLPGVGARTWTLEVWQTYLEMPGIWRAMGLSLLAGLASAALALAIVCLFMAAWSGTRFFARIQSLISPLLSVPHAAAALGLAFLVAPSGWILRLLSPAVTGFARPPDWLILNDPWAVSLILGLVFKEIPFLLLVSLAALRQLDEPRSILLAQSFGYGRVVGWLLLVWPRLYRLIRLPVFAVIAYSASVVDVAIILGPVTPPTLSVLLLEWMNDPDLSLRLLASAGALAQLGIVCLALMLWWLGEKGAAALFPVILMTGRRFRLDGAMRLTIAVVMLLSVGAILFGLLGLIVWSFAGFWRFPAFLPLAFTLENWARALNSLQEPLWTSIHVGLGAAFLALVLTLACLQNEYMRRFIASNALRILYVPLIIPQMAFLFGLQVLFIRFGVSATYGALIFVHLIFVLPYTFLSLAEPFRQWDTRFAVVAESLGASAWRVFWRIRLPMLTGPVLTAAAIGFSVSIGQYLPTVLIGEGRLTTITTEAVALSSGGDRRVVGVYALVQMVLPFIGFAIALAVPALYHRNHAALKSAQHR